MIQKLFSPTASGRNNNSNNNGQKQQRQARIHEGGYIKRGRRESLLPNLMSLFVLPMLTCMATLFTVLSVTNSLFLLTDNDNENEYSNQMHLKQQKQSSESLSSSWIPTKRSFFSTSSQSLLTLTSSSPRRDNNSDTTIINFDDDDYHYFDSMMKKLPPSVWATTVGDHHHRWGSWARVATTTTTDNQGEKQKKNDEVLKLVSLELSNNEKIRCLQLCGDLFYSTLRNAIHVMGQQTYVATGDIDSMWTRDSAVQMGLYMSRMSHQPWLRYIVEGSIRRQAFNIIQDPYANAYNRKWIDSSTSLKLKDRIIGRGGYVATRNYELDSGAYFLTQIYDYYVIATKHNIYRPDILLQEAMIYDSIILLIDTWIIEQNHEELSEYRYFELSRDGLGEPARHTGMTWSAFRPSDEPCRYGYHIPSNIFAAASLERIVQINNKIWKSSELHNKATKLLQDITDGINKYGIISRDDGDGGSIRVYAYEVDGFGMSYTDFDDANVPSLLSIPLLGWSGYDHNVYLETRKRILSSKINRFYIEQQQHQQQHQEDGRHNTHTGMGSTHTPAGYVWPMSFAVQALTSQGITSLDVANDVVYQIRQLLISASCRNTIHESVDSMNGCKGGYTREWFEWANAMFIILIEHAFGERCDIIGHDAIQRQMANEAVTNEIMKSKNITARKKRQQRLGQQRHPSLHLQSQQKHIFTYYTNPYNNNHTNPLFYQGIEASSKHVD